MTNPAADISIVIPAHDVAGYVGRAIRSALEGCSARIELIVVDDASADSTAGVVRAHAKQDARVKLIQLDANSGPSAARNAGIQRATGEYVAFMDADDWCAAGRVERLASLARRQGADIVTDNLYLVGGTDQQPWADIHSEYGVRYHDGEHIRPLEYISRGWVVHPLVRRQRMLAEGLLFDQGVNYGEDYILYSSMLMQGWKWVVSETPLYFQLARAGSLTRSNKIPRRLSEYLESAVADAVARGDKGCAAAFRYKRARVESTVAWRTLRQAMSERRLSDTVGAAMRVIRCSPVYSERLLKKAKRSWKMSRGRG